MAYNTNGVVKSVALSRRIDIGGPMIMNIFRINCERRAVSTFWQNIVNKATEVMIYEFKASIA